MANFMNFGATIKNATSTSSAQLKPWEIHEVTFKGVKFDKLNNKKDPSQPYQVMKIRFENEDGYFEKLVFAIKEGDEIRGKVGDREMVSNYENLQFLVIHMIEIMNPKAKDKFIAAIAKIDISQNFEKFVAVLTQVLQPAVDKTFKLKLNGDKNNKPVLPYFVAINKEGEAFFANNFLGDKLFFSEYELETQKKFEKGAPKATDMSKVTTSEDITETGNDSEDLDFDVEDLDIEE